ncbi:hypothetical protein P170DRAFT_425219 [Aspergillus steynii IBT 23096]|uniref:Uncharacterized protein n=1 Tax=Aspergillus steynii IBT 23096 TaxID=1392250 RepID=A0A2I2GDE2_9EURO|nr:uncharacterized protein P170DRAFT_425219 [Aspergillus steynii IBT 23096]PLB50926.1 hypothetical protein P170DRAFT_425219 [Aspergillus steynii IBT 23096]
MRFTLLSSAAFCGLFLSAAAVPIAAIPRSETPAIADDLAHTADAGEHGTGFPGAGIPEAINPGVGAPGAGTPGAGTPGAGTPDAGTPGAGTPGAGTPGAGTPGATQPGNPTGVGSDGRPCGGRNPDGLVNGALDGVNTVLCEGAPETPLDTICWRRAENLANDKDDFRWFSSC